MFLPAQVFLGILFSAYAIQLLYLRVILPAIENTNGLKNYSSRYLLVQNKNGNNITICEIYSESTIKTQNNINDVLMVSLLWSLNRFQRLFWCFHCWLWTSKCQLGIYLFFSITWYLWNIRILGFFSQFWSSA